MNNERLFLSSGQMQIVQEKGGVLIWPEYFSMVALQPIVSHEVNIIGGKCIFKNVIK